MPAGVMFGELEVGDFAGLGEFEGVSIKTGVAQFKELYAGVSKRFRFTPGYGKFDGVDFRARVFIGEHDFSWGRGEES